MRQEGGGGGGVGEKRREWERTNGNRRGRGEIKPGEKEERGKNVVVNVGRREEEKEGNRRQNEEWKYLLVPPKPHIPFLPFSQSHIHFLASLSHTFHSHLFIPHLLHALPGHTHSPLISYIRTIPPFLPPQSHILSLHVIFLSLYCGIISSSQALPH